MLGREQRGRARALQQQGSHRAAADQRALHAQQRDQVRARRQVAARPRAAQLRQRGAALEPRLRQQRLRFRACAKLIVYTETERKPHCCHAAILQCQLIVKYCT